MPPFSFTSNISSHSTKQKDDSAFEMKAKQQMIYGCSAHQPSISSCLLFHCLTPSDLLPSLILL